MKPYTYQNTLIGKKQLRHLLAWSFTNYDSMQACLLADELKYLGFKYATQAGISISIEDLKIPFVKNVMLKKANQEIHHSEKIFLKGKITEVERFQKIIDTWSLTSESLKNQIIFYFKNYDPLNSVYIMAFSGARGNLSQVRQLVGMRGLMSDPSGQIMNLPIKKNFREGLTITDYLMSGYGARKGIVDTALKTANSGYLTRRLIDVSQDILIREKDCFTTHSFLFSTKNFSNPDIIYNKILGCVLNKSVFHPETSILIAHQNTQITPELLQTFKEKNIKDISIRSPLSCKLYRSICQKCYGWDLSNENLVDMGEAIGILAGQSIGEPGTQLTMRTFHTGGIFTSEARQQIISPLNGIIQFYKQLKTVILRTNRGEDVLVTKNSGSLVLIPDNKNEDLIKIDIFRNTILFPKNNQYILKDTVIGELINTNKQIKSEVKTILSDKCGEIFIPKLKQKINLLNNNRLIWILSGQLYNIPLHSFLNFYPDYKINKFSYVFRTKLINHYSGIVTFLHNQNSVYQDFVKVNNHQYSFINSKLEQLSSPLNNKTHLFTLNKFKYFVTIKKKGLKNYLQLSRNEKFGTFITNSFLTRTGGTIFYNFKNYLDRSKVIYFRKNRAFYFYELELEKIDQTIGFIESRKKPTNKQIERLGTAKRVRKKFKEFIPSLLNQQLQQLKKLKRSNDKSRTMIWLEEEIHKIKCDPNTLFVEEGDFISKGFEIVPERFSRTSGFVTILKKSDKVQIISIKSGLVYKGNKHEKIDKKVYYPGEKVLSHVTIQNLSFCDYIGTKNNDQLLIRPIKIYEVPYLISNPLESQNEQSNFQFKLTINSIPFYKSKQRINGVNNFNLILNFLVFKTNSFSKKNIHLELLKNRHKKLIEFHIIEKLSLNNYIGPNLRYRNIQPCFISQNNQFLSNYNILGYLETSTLNSVEIVKFKRKKKVENQIFLISNHDCITVPKTEIANKKINDFVMSKSNLVRTGKIIIENQKFVTIQKGRPYFFPNCKTNNLVLKTNLQYKIIPQFIGKFSIPQNRNIFVSCSDLSKLLVKETLTLKNVTTYEFPKFFLKNNGKLYSSLIPHFSKKFTITDKKSNCQLKTILSPYSQKYPGQIFAESPPLNRTILLQNSDLTFNNNRKTNLNSKMNQLTLVKVTEQPYTKSAKSVGLSSITEDYFEQEVNSLFCKNTQFIESDTTLGLLNLEKEITGDIVQGLPRIEEILEARKKNMMVKRIPTSQKKGLLTQKTSLDNNFEFKKVGTSIKENEKINPHKLVKVYFNYYGFLKFFFCDRTKSFKYGRLTNNYEACNRSFKKVQLFILASVQSVYKSQGVSINDKHLEVIIKQMTTKVLITSEGDTPLLRREVIDLYHIQYINNILKNEDKEIAYYVPLLLGITKAALNNPSFISAASFQETTRVLTKAAIEGRIDWLRGLKENIIIGHLIPAGTGSPNYRNCFKKYSFKTQYSSIYSEQLSSELFENTGQIN